MSFCDADKETTTTKAFSGDKSFLHKEMMWMKKEKKKAFLSAPQHLTCPRVNHKRGSIKLQ